MDLISVYVLAIKHIESPFAEYTTIDGKISKPKSKNDLISSYPPEGHLIEMIRMPPTKRFHSPIKDYFYRVII